MFAYCLFCYIFSNENGEEESNNKKKKRWVKEDNTKLKHLIRCFRCCFFLFRSLLSFIVCWHSFFLPKYLLHFFFLLKKPCVQVARFVNRSSKQSFYYDFSVHCYFGFLLRFLRYFVILPHFFFTSFNLLFDLVLIFFSLPEHARKGWLFSPRSFDFQSSFDSLFDRSMHFLTDKVCFLFFRGTVFLIH